MNKFLIGSKLLDLINNKDEDYICLTDEEKFRKEFIDNKEILYMPQNMLLSRLNFQLDDNYGHLRYYLYITSYQYDQNIIGQDFPIKYHYLEHKDQYMKLIDHIIKNKEFNFNKDITADNRCCTKIIYHIAYNIFILKNNSPIITEEQKAIIQKIHDLEMPIDYLDELEKTFKSIKNINSNDSNNQ